MPITTLKQEDIPTPTESIYMLSYRDIFTLMVTGHATYYEHEQKFNLPISKQEIALVTGKKSPNRSNEVSLRHALAAGLLIHQVPYLRTLYQRGYNASIANLSMHHGIEPSAAIHIARYIESNAHDRIGTTTNNYTDAIEYLLVKEAITKNTKMAFSRDFLKLSHGKEFHLTHNDPLNINFHWTVFTRLIEFKHTNELHESEHSYVDLLIKMEWYSINADARFQHTLKAKRIIN